MSLDVTYQKGDLSALGRTTEALTLGVSAALASADRVVKERATRPHQSVRRTVDRSPKGLTVTWQITPPRPHPIDKAPGFLHFVVKGHEVFTHHVNWRPVNRPKASYYANVPGQILGIMEPFVSHQVLKVVRPK